MMGRIAFRYTIRGTLTAESALNVAGLGAEGTVDLGQLRDGMGRVVIPGTSLAGVIRAALPHDDQTWWGTHLGGSGSDNGAHASRITIADAAATSQDIALEVRDGVSIDRVTGAAAERHLFSRAVVPAGTRFDFRLDAEVPTADFDSAVRNFVLDVAALLRGPGITVGSAGTRGLGRLRLAEADIRREDFTSQAGLLQALGARGSEIEVAGTTEDGVPPGILRITVPWRPLGPVMSKVADDSGGFSDGFPAVTTDSAGVRLVIYGSSLKGTLRSHAERIMRTLRNEPLGTADFGEQMERSARLPGIGEIFGAAGNLAGNEPGRRGMLTVRDVTSATALPAAQWGLVRTGGTPPARANVDDDHDSRREALATAVRRLNSAVESEGLWFDIASRNAIDRWTGAAADSLLYTTVEPHAFGDGAARAWTPLVLDLDVARARRHGTSVNALLAMLIFLVRDFAEGWIPIGFGTTRGLGAVRAELGDVRLEFNGEHHNDDCAALVNCRALSDILADSDVTSCLDEAWKEVTTCPTSQSPAD